MKLNRRAFFKGLFVSAIAAIAAPLVASASPKDVLTKEMCMDCIDKSSSPSYTGYHLYDTWGPDHYSFWGRSSLQGMGEVLDKEDTVVRYEGLKEEEFERLLAGSLTVNTILVDSWSKAVALETDRMFMRGHG